MDNLLKLAMSVVGKAKTGIDNELLQMKKEPLGQTPESRQKLIKHAMDMVVGATAAPQSRFATLPASSLITHEAAPDIDRIVEYITQIKTKGIKSIDPLKVIIEGGGKHGIEDGKHRFEAMKMLGIKDIPVEIIRHWTKKPIK